MVEENKFLSKLNRLFSAEKFDVNQASILFHQICNAKNRGYKISSEEEVFLTSLTQKVTEVKITDAYEEQHFQQIDDVGIAWNYNRVWVCFNGAAVFRAKVIEGKLFIEFNPPETSENRG